MVIKSKKVIKNKTLQNKSKSKKINTRVMKGGVYLTYSPAAQKMLANNRKEISRSMIIRTIVEQKRQANLKFAQELKKKQMLEQTKQTPNPSKLDKRVRNSVKVAKAKKQQRTTIKK